MDLELWPNCLNQPWPGLCWSSIAAGLNFYLLPMALSLSWAILGIDREQLKKRIFGQRIADVFLSQLQFGLLTIPETGSISYQILQQGCTPSYFPHWVNFSFWTKNTLSKKSVSGTVLGQNPLEWKLHYRKSRYMGTRFIPTVILPKNQWSNIQFG